MGNRVELTTSPIFKQYIAMDTILQNFQVFLDFTREHFMTFILSCTHDKCYDIAQVLPFGSSLGQNYELLQALMHN